MILEACVENFSEALKAENAGANRIELCDNLFVGGTTPSYGTIKTCCSKLRIPVATMIRPRGGDFCYSDEEFSIMQEDIKICREIGCQAVVFGILTSSKVVDIERCKILVKLAQPMEVVFHKAFDEIANSLEALDQLIQLGFSRILTSGTRETALEGKDLLNQLLARANNNISILVAGRVTYENLPELQKLIPANEFHGRKIVKY